MMYAIYDTQDKCWLGTEKGVKTWKDERIACAAATVAAKQLGVAKRGRFRAAKYKGDAKKHKDEIPTKMTPLEAIQEIEGFCDWPKGAAKP